MRDLARAIRAVAKIPIATSMSGFVPLSRPRMIPAPSISESTASTTIGL